MTKYEVIGIIGSIFIVGCLLFRTTTFKGTMLMRIINTLGSILFVVYGQFIRAYSTAITNLFCTIVNIYYIVREIRWHKEKKDKDNDMPR